MYANVICLNVETGSRDHKQTAIIYLSFQLKREHDRIIKLAQYTD